MPNDSLISEIKRRIVAWWSGGRAVGAAGLDGMIGPADDFLDSLDEAQRRAVFSAIFAARGPFAVDRAGAAHRS